MSPTEKAVLMAIADRADDAGLAWPGIPDLCEATCFSRRAVIAALKALDQDHAGLLVVERTAGRNNRMTVSLPAVAAALRLVVEKGKPSARREVVAALEWVTAKTSTSASDAPVQEPWFVAPDVCKALGVENIPDALAFQDDEEKGFDSIETLVARRRWRSSSSPASTT